MDDIPIPPEVISALRVGTCCGCNKCLSKALRDALKAWPDMSQHVARTWSVMPDVPLIILPLPQEARDENHLRPDRRTNVAERLFDDD